MMEAIIGFFGVLVGGAITVAKDVLIARLDRQRHGIYAAIRIIGVLDEYVQKCLDVVYDDGTSEGRPAGRTESGEEYHEPQVSEPAPPLYPEDIDWKSLPKALAYRALTLPNSARETNRGIALSEEHSFPPGYEEIFAARQEGYARLGLETIGLAAALRTQFTLPPKKYSGRNNGWTPEKFFKERLSEAKGNTGASLL